MIAKTPLLLTLALGVATTLCAQQVEYVVFSRDNGYTQTAWNSVGQSTTNPWTVGFYVSGTSLDSGNPVTSVSFSTPTGSGVASGNLSFNNGEWAAEYPYSNAGDMLTAFPDADGSSGFYTLTFNGGTYTTTGLTTNSMYFPNNPMLSLSSGSADWYTSNGVTYLVVDPTQDLVLTTNTYTTNFHSGYTRIGWEVSGSGYYLDNGDGDLVGNSATITIAANSLISGNTYDLSVEFDRFLALSSVSGSGIAGLDGADVLSFLSSTTSFQIYAYSAVPEPSTYALLVGAVALGGVVWRRRRRG